MPVRFVQAARELPAGASVGLTGSAGGPPAIWRSGSKFNRKERKERKER
jgi:hypothetical protein